MLQGMQAKPEFLVSPLDRDTVEILWHCVLWKGLKSKSPQGTIQQDSEVFLTTWGSPKPKRYQEQCRKLCWSMHS